MLSATLSGLITSHLISSGAVCHRHKPVGDRLRGLMPRTLAFLGVASAMAFSQTASAQFAPYPSRVQQQRGATVGGLAGAVIGAVIGDNNNEAGAGAAIGGVVGAVAGGVLGNAADKERAYVGQQRAINQSATRQFYSPPQYVPPQTAVGLSDVIQMSRSGLSENVIINQIQSRGVTTQIQVPDILELHRQGVSENVITSMQRAPVGPLIATQNAPPQQVIVRERVVVPQQVDIHHFHPHHRGRVYVHGF